MELAQRLSRYTPLAIYIEMKGFAFVNTTATLGMPRNYTHPAFK